MIARWTHWVAAGAAMLASVAVAGSIEVMDQRGKVLALAAPPTRAAFIPMPSVSMWVGIDGSAKRVVAMNPASITAIRGEILGHLFPALLTVPTNIIAGGQFTPNVESLLRLRPEVTVQWADQPQDVISALERAGLRVFGMRTGSQDELETWVHALGRLSGHEAKADALIEQQRTLRRSIEAATASVRESDRPRVLYLQRAEQGLRPNGAGSYNDFYIRLAGGRNAADGVKGTGTDVTFEQVLAWNPAVILLGGFDAAVPADLYRERRWQGISAVRERRVYKVPLGGYRWDPPSLESPLMWQWLLGLLHPARTTADLRVAIEHLYEALYARAPTPAEMDRLLMVTANAASTGYERYVRR